MMMLTLVAMLQLACYNRNEGSFIVIKLRPSGTAIVQVRGTQKKIAYERTYRFTQS
jgi:hypothetical protein